MLHRFLILAVLACAPLSATTVVQLDFDRLSRLAERVVRGEVVRVAPVRGENGYIYSDVTLRVLDANPKSLRGGEYTFRTVGGEMDGRRVSIQGMPLLREGEDVVLFLSADTGSVFGPTVGLWQGVFYVERGGDGTDVVVDHARRPVMSVREKNLVIGTRGGAKADGPSQGSAGAMTVSDFFSAVDSRR